MSACVGIYIKRHSQEIYRVPVLACPLEIEIRREDGTTGPIIHIFMQGGAPVVEVLQK